MGIKETDSFGPEASQLRAALVRKERIEASAPLTLQLYDFGLHILIRNYETPNGNGKIESSWSCAARIEVQYAIFLLGLWLVRMPADDHLKTGRERIQVQIVQVVKDIHTPPIELNQLGRRELAGRRVSIDVSANSDDRGDFSQSVEYVGVSDIACMDDERRATQGGNGLRSQQAVSVRDHSDMSYHGPVPSSRGIR
jgi:hypothetical protein